MFYFGILSVIRKSVFQNLLNKSKVLEKGYIFASQMQPSLQFHYQLQFHVYCLCVTSCSSTHSSHCDFRKVRSLSRKLRYCHEISRIEQLCGFRLHTDTACSGVLSCKAVQTWRSKPIGRAAVSLRLLTKKKWIFFSALCGRYRWRQ